MAVVWHYLIGAIILIASIFWVRKTKPKYDFIKMCDLMTSFKEKQHSVREHTWQSVVLDGELMEGIGASVISAIGHGSRGQAPGGNLSNQGDYKNGMECKSGQRDFPQIEFLLNGQILESPGLSGSFADGILQLNLDNIDSNTLRQLNERYRKLHSSIQGDYATIQVVERRLDGQYYAIPKLGKSTKNCLFRVDRAINPDGILVWLDEAERYEPKGWDKLLSKTAVKKMVKDLPLDDRRGYATMNLNQLCDLLPNDPRLPDGTYIRIAAKPVIQMDTGEDFDFMFRQEDGHTNWAASRQKQEAWFDAGGMVLVNSYRDKLARVNMAVFRFNPYGQRREKFMQFWDVKDPHVNMRLFYNARRDKLNEDNWSYLTWDCELVALAVQQKKSFKLLHWKPDGGEDCKLSKEKMQNLILHPKATKNDPPVRSPIYKLDWNNEEERRECARWFFEECILDFFRKWIPIAVKTGVTKNIGFGHLTEHLGSLWFGLRGCRVKKGADFYEHDGKESELKTCCGDEDDFIDTKHPSTNIMISAPIQKIQSWHRLFVNRIYCVEEEISGKLKGNLKIALLAPTQQTMSDLHHGLSEFYVENPTSPGKLQWQGRPFEENYWQQHATRPGGILRLERIVEFIQYPQDGDDKVRIVTKEIPEVVDCVCGICQADGAWWFPPPPSSTAMIGKDNQSRAWRNSRTLMVGNPLTD
jgi:hypothetical protein